MSDLKRTLSLLMLALCLNAAQGCSTAAREQRASAESSKVETGERRDPKTLEYSLLNQDGQKVSLYGDLLKDKIVVMNFIFTDCNTFCEAQGQRFSQLQDSLGDRLGGDVNLISLSKDPKNDSPKELKSWGKRHHMKSGWTLLTGELPEVTKVFMAFTGDPPIVIEHSPVMLIGNADKNKWIRTSGLDPIDDILQLIEKVR